MKLALALGIALLGWPALSSAQSGPPAAGTEPHPTGVHVVDDSEPLPPLVPRAKDLLGGHLLVGASVAPVWTLGRLGSRVPADRALGVGVGFQGDVGFGLSRTVVLGAWGSFARYADGDACSSCSGTSFAAGPFVRYQLSQGLRFVPWVLAGAGYRRISFEADQAKQKYSGVEWLRFELGGDYYVWSGMGLGPYGALSLSSFAKRPSDAGEARVNTELSVGLRFLLDLPGR